jgi:hypothetical protein
LLTVVGGPGGGDRAAVSPSPVGEFQQRLVEVLGHFRQRVLDLGRDDRIDGAYKQAVPLQLAQREREHAPADPSDRTFQLREPDRALRDGYQDADAPLPGDVIEDLRHRARLAGQG